MLKCYFDKWLVLECEWVEKEFDVLRRASDALFDVDARRALDDFLCVKVV